MRTFVVVLCLGIATLIVRQVAFTKLIDMTIIDIALYILAAVIATPGVLVAAQPLKDPDPHSSNDLFELMPILAGVLVMLVVLNF
jgi:hypothetical protein